MTQEQWNLLKPGDIILRGWDSSKYKVVSKVKDGKREGYSIILIQEPKAFNAFEPLAYEVEK